MRRYHSFLYALLLAATLAAPRLSAQPQLDPMAAGRKYIVAFPDTTRNTYDTRFSAKRFGDTIALYIYSPVATKVKITGSGGYTNDVNVQAGRFAEVYLDRTGNPAPNPILDESGVVSDKVFRVEALSPVILYCYLCTNFGGEAWTPLPVESWGMEYIAAAMPGEVVKDIQSPPAHFAYSTKNRAAPAQITILSAYDSTHVTITPTRAGQFEGAPPLTVTLGADRAYQLQSVVDTTTASLGLPKVDITGARIVSDKPIGVLCGTTRTIVTPDSLCGLAQNTQKNMSIEALAPVDEHGTLFVVTPLADDRMVTGQPGEMLAEKRRSERARIVASDSLIVRRYGDTTGMTTLGPLSAHAFIDDTLKGTATTRPHVYSTFGRAQAFNFPAPVSKDLIAAEINKSYDSWGSFMVEMVPHEQWVTFAPFIAPIHPGAMRHYVNIVTDTNSRLKIQDENRSVVSGWRTIPGTRFCWAFRSVVPGVTKYFQSTDSNARFYAFAYGLYRGHEEYRGASQSEYEEYIGLSYGYPLAPRRAALFTNDSFKVRTDQKCDSLGVVFSLMNYFGETPAGFREISVDPGASNASITFLDTQVLGSNRVRIVVRAWDRGNNASATFRIVERSGAVHTYTYTYTAQRLTVSPVTSLLFGETTKGRTKDMPITVINPLTSPVLVRDISTASLGEQRFTVIAPSPTTAITLQPGESMPVTVRFAPTTENTRYTDTLRISLDCNVMEIPLSGETVAPCVYVGDLNFGTFVLGRDGARTLPLQICNQGRGEIHFSDIPGAGAVVSWLDSHFSIPSSTLDSLRTTVLGPNGSSSECFTLFVTYTPESAGTFSTTAKFSTDIDCIRDTSVWRAQVEGIGGVAWSSVAVGAATLRPTPAHDNAELLLNLRRAGSVTLALIDARGAEVLRSEQHAEAGLGAFTLDVGELPSGVYYCRIAVNGAVQVLPLVVAR